MSVRAAAPTQASPISAEKADGTNVVDLGEGASGFPVQDPENPLTRRVVSYIRANLAELSNSSAASTWSLNEAQLESIFKQMRFLDLSGNTKSTGDLASTVLHSVDAINLKSTFPIQLGIKVTGVENKAFSSIGVPYSLITMSNASSNIPIELQKEDVSVGRPAADLFPQFPASFAPLIFTHSPTHSLTPLSLYTP